MPGSSELFRQSPASCEPELQQCPSTTTAPSFLCSYRNRTGCAWETTHPGETLDHLMTGPPHAQDHIFVDQGRDDGADNWPDPVDEIILPEAASQSWAESARRIHRCTRQRSAHQDIYQRHQADAKATDFWGSWIDGGSEDSQQQEERQDRLNQDTCAEGDTRREVGCAEFGRLPDRLRINGPQQQSGQGCANELGHDIEDPQKGRNAPRYQKSDGDSGVEMSSRDRREDGDQDGKCQSMGQGDA